MSMLVRFSPQDVTIDRYEAVMSRLKEAGHWPPDGLQYHVCFGEESHIKVSEIWSSSDQFEAFGQHLMPILDAEGITMSAEPERLKIHNQERF